MELPNHNDHVSYRKYVLHNKKLVQMIIDRGGHLKDYGEPVGKILTSRLQSIGMRALMTMEPRSVISGCEPIYKQALKLHETVRFSREAGDCFREIFRLLRIGAFRESELFEDPAYVKAIKAIDDVLTEHIEALKPVRIRGQPPASDFINVCCEAALNIEEDTGIPIVKAGRTNPDMIDLVTEFLRGVPDEARLDPTVDDEVDRDAHDPHRKGVSAALRKGRKAGLIP